MPKENLAATEPATYTPRPAPPSPMRLRRLKAGAVLRDVSAATGFSIALISDIETGRRAASRAERSAIAEAVEKHRHGEAVVSGPLLSNSQVAEKLGAREVPRILRMKGGGPKFLRIGGPSSKALYTEEDVNEWLASKPRFS